MSTAYRSDLVRSVYATELGKLTLASAVRLDATLVSCPKQDCGVQYIMLEPVAAAEDEILRHRAAVAKAMQQQFCPHHPPKIELD
jgi:hypothetical protein